MKIVNKKRFIIFCVVCFVAFMAFNVWLNIKLDEIFVEPLFEKYLTM